MTVLERLATLENFKTWTWGGIDKALAKRKSMEEEVRGRKYIAPEGAWDGEPDKVQWIDRGTGYDCLIVRNPMGALCGYVGVPPGHPWHGIDYGDCVLPTCAEEEEHGYCEHRPDSYISVHGGLTFSAFCQPGEPVEGVCHRAMDGRPDNVWWFGFDCGHAWDIIPGMDTFLSMGEGFYKDIEYVVGQITEEAAQLKVVELEQRVTTAEVAQAVQSITSDMRPKVE